MNNDNGKQIKKTETIEVDVYEGIVNKSIEVVNHILVKVQNELEICLVKHPITDIYIYGVNLIIVVKNN